MLLTYSAQESIESSWTTKDNDIPLISIIFKNIKLIKE